METFESKKFCKEKKFLFIKPLSLLMAVIFLITNLPVDVLCIEKVQGGSSASYEEQEAYPKDLDVLSMTLPANLGEIKYNRKGESGKTVIHIEDAHCNYFAQEKISEIIGYFNKEYGIEMLNLEGGCGEYDLSVFHSIPNTLIRAEVCKDFIRSGEMNGAEYYGSMNPGKVLLWGVENSSLYLKNLKAYRDAAKKQEYIKETLRSLAGLLSICKKNIYSKELLHVDSIIEAYTSGEVKFKKHILALIKLADEFLIERSSFPDINIMEKVINLENKIDFKKAQKERKELIDYLQDIFSRREKKELVEKVIKFKKKEIKDKDFYKYLFYKAEGLNLPSGKYSALKDYREYIELYTGIDRTGIIFEMESMESDIKAELFRNKKERELSRISENFRILSDFFNFSLIKDKFDRYKKDPEEFNPDIFYSFINKNLPGEESGTLNKEAVEILNSGRADVEQFYEYSFARDKAFMNNIRFRDNKALLVTGGFHTENLLKLFDEENISYISIVPEFKSEEDYKNPYFDLLGGRMSGDYGAVYGILFGTYALQIASKLTVLAKEVWGQEVVDCYNAVVMIHSKVKEGKQIVVTTKDGREVKFGEDNKDIEKISQDELRKYIVPDTGSFGITGLRGSPEVSASENELTVDLPRKADQIAPEAFAASEVYDSRRDGYEYKKEFIKERFRILGKDDPWYRAAKEAFDDLMDTLFKKGLISPDRKYELIVYDSEEMNGSYWIGGDSVMMSTGLLKELDKYLKSENKPGIAKDHIAGILAHELQHSLQNYDSYEKTWIEKKGEGRKKEYDADRESLFFMDKAGYNPWAMVEVMEAFDAFEKNATLKNRAYRVIGTHPVPIDRRNLLARIVSDKNAVLRNTRKPFQIINAGFKQDFLERLKDINSIEEVFTSPGNINEKLMVLYILRETDFIDKYGTDYAIDEQKIQTLFDPSEEVSWMFNLMNYLRMKYPDASSEWLYFMYEANFGFLFDRDNQRDYLNLLLEPLTGEEKKLALREISNNPPLYTQDLEVSTEMKTDFGEKYYKPFLENNLYKSYGNSYVVLLNALRDMPLEENLVNIRSMFKSYYYFYSNNMFRNQDVWVAISRFLGHYIRDRGTLNVFINVAEIVFKDQGQAGPEFNYHLARHMIEMNPFFQRLPFNDKIEVISRIMKDSQGDVNDIFRSFWTRYKEDILALPVSGRKQILEALVQSVNLNVMEPNRYTFFDQTGTAVLGVGAGLEYLNQFKSLYGEITRELADIEFSAKDDRSQEDAIKDIISMIDRNVLPDYQDLVDIFGEYLVRATAEDYLEISGAIERFIEQNLSGKEKEEERWTQELAYTRAARYHDIFALAYLYKSKGVPFTFLETKNVSEITPRWNGPVDYTKFDKVPLCLEIIDDRDNRHLSGEKVIYRNGSIVGREADYSVFESWSFDLKSVFDSLFPKIGFSLDMDSIRTLKDNVLLKKDLEEWLSLFYPYILYEDESVLEIIEYLRYADRITEEPVFTSPQGSNYYEVVRIFKKDRLRGSNGLTAVENALSDNRSWDIGFRMWIKNENRYPGGEYSEFRDKMKALQRYFPNDSKVRGKEAEKIFISFLSGLSGIDYETAAVQFRYLTGTKQHFIDYEDFRPTPDMRNFSPDQDQAENMIKAFELTYDLISSQQRVELGKFVYGILKNNRGLEYFSGAEENIELIERLFPFYSKAKDDYIFEMLEEFYITRDSYEQGIKLTSSFAYQDSSREVNRAFSFSEFMKRTLAQENRDEKRKWLLWFVTGKKEYMPVVVKNMESQNKANAESFISQFWRLTYSERMEFLSEMLMGDKGLFNVDYRSGILQQKVSKGNLRNILASKILETFEIERNLAAISNFIKQSYYDAFFNIDGEKRKGWLKKQLAENLGVFDEVLDNEKFGDDLIEFLEEKTRANNPMKDTLSDKVDDMMDKCVEIASRTGRKLDSGLIDQIKVNFVVSFEDRSFVEEVLWREDKERMTYVVNQLLSSMMEDLPLSGLRSAGYVYTGKKGTADLKEEAKSYYEEVIPILVDIATVGLVIIIDNEKTIDEFYSREVPQDEIKSFLQKRLKESLNREKSIFRSLKTKNPQFLDLKNIMEEFNVLDYEDKNKIEGYAEFESFIKTFIRERLSGYFAEGEIEIVEALLEIKFKQHTLERKVQFLNDLIEKLKKSDTKADMIIAFAEAGGVPIVKLFQIFSQRGLFSELAEDEEEGRELNERIGEVKSESDPIRKATIFSALESAGLEEIIALIGPRLGSASIKQVHMAELSEPVVINGVKYKRVALKVMRPSAMKHFTEDFEVLKSLLEYFVERFPDSNISMNVLGKIKTSLEEEMKFEDEVKAQKRFIENSQKRNSPVHIPFLVFPLETRDGDNIIIILDEFVEGRTLKNIDEKDLPYGIYKTVVNEFLEQIFVDGFFHADLHDGNIMITDDGTITMIDLGAFGEIDKGNIRPVYNLLLSLMRGNRRAFLRALNDLGFNADEMSDSVRDIFNASKNSEERFEKVFSLFSDSAEGMPQWLFMFFQALSKTGTYFDKAGFAKYLMFMKFHPVAGPILAISKHIIAVLLYPFKFLLNKINRIRARSSISGAGMLAAVFVTIMAINTAISSMRNTLRQKLTAPAVQKTITEKMVDKPAVPDADGTARGENVELRNIYDLLKQTPGLHKYLINMTFKDFQNYQKDKAFRSVLEKAGNMMREATPEKYKAIDKHIKHVILLPVPFDFTRVDIGVIVVGKQKLDRHAGNENLNAAEIVNTFIHEGTHVKDFQEGRWPSRETLPEMAKLEERAYRALVDYMEILRKLGLYTDKDIKQQKFVTRHIKDNDYSGAVARMVVSPDQESVRRIGPLILAHENIAKSLNSKDGSIEYLRVKRETWKNVFIGEDGKEYSEDAPVIRVILKTGTEIYAVVLGYDGKIINKPVPVKDEMDEKQKHEGKRKPVEEGQDASKEGFVPEGKPETEVLPEKESIEAQIKAAKKVTGDLRQGIMDWVITPIREHAGSAKESVDSQVSRKFRKDYGSETVLREYLFDPDLSDAAFENNIRHTLERVVVEMIDPKKAEKRPRALAFIPGEDKRFNIAMRVLKEIAVSPRFEPKLLSLSSRENYRQVINAVTDRISLVRIANVSAEGLIDEVMHVVLAKSLLNYDRFKKEKDWRESDFTQEQKLNILYFLEQLVEPGSIDFTKYKGDPDELINMILEGLQMLEVKEVTGEIEAWKESQQAVLISL